MLFKKERCYQLQSLLHITQSSLFYARAFLGCCTDRKRVWRPGFHPSSTSYELPTPWAVTPLALTLQLLLPTLEGYDETQTINAQGNTKR